MPGRGSQFSCMSAPTGKRHQKVLETKFRVLGRRLKAMTPNIAFLEVLPDPCAGPPRQGSQYGDETVTSEGGGWIFVGLGKILGTSRVWTRGTSFT